MHCNLKNQITVLFYTFIFKNGDVAYDPKPFLGQNYYRIQSVNHITAT